MSEARVQQQVPAGDAVSAEPRIGRPIRSSNGQIWAPVGIGWRYRELILAVLRRQLADRFSDSLFGWGWAIAAPLMTLAIYTVTFASALRLPVASARGGTMDYALSTFAGLIVFNLAAELCYRAPLLLHEHASYIKTSIFPSETLAWTAVLRSLTYAGISVAVLLVFAFAINWRLPVTVLLLPFLVVPMTLLLLGFVWCLSALGAFSRDIAYLMITIVPLMMFATPVFYRMSDLPPTFRTLEYFNPMAIEIDMVRNILIDGVLPPLWLYGGFVVTALVVCRVGYAVFERYKGILVDVI
jgi:lipopolysaccharide transport system permease protein